MQVQKEKMLKILSKIIEAERLKTCKKIYQISAEAGIDYSTWRKIEQGKYKDIKLSSLWKISEALEIYPDELIKKLRMELGEDFTLFDIE